MPSALAALSSASSICQHESEHNLYLTCEDSAQRVFIFCNFSRSLLAFLASFCTWLRCFLFLSVANRRQSMYIMKTIRLIGKKLRWLVNRNFIGRGELQRPSWSTNTTNRPWIWTVAWTWANYGMHHLTNRLNHYKFIFSIFIFSILTPPISIYSCRYLTLVFSH